MPRNLHPTAERAGGSAEPPPAPCACGPAAGRVRKQRLHSSSPGAPRLRGGSGSSAPGGEEEEEEEEQEEGGERAREEGKGGGFCILRFLPSSETERLWPTGSRQSSGNRGAGEKERKGEGEEGSFLLKKKKKKNSFFPYLASSEPTRGWLAPGYNYWLLLVGACRAESRAASRPCSLLRFLVRIRISPSIPWRGGQCFSWTPAQRVPQ